MPVMSWKYKPRYDAKWNASWYHKSVLKLLTRAASRYPSWQATEMSNNYYANQDAWRHLMYTERDCAKICVVVLHIMIKTSKLYGWDDQNVYKVSPNLSKNRKTTTAG